MATAELIMNASLVPDSELISRAVQGAYDIIRAARDVLVERHNFAEMAAYLDRVVPILDQLMATTPAGNRDGSFPLAAAAEILAREVEAARALALDCGKRNRVYLLLNCRRIVTRLESATREIGRAISLLPLASFDLSSAIRDEAKLLSDSMVRAEFRAAAAEEEILRKVESAIQEHNSDRSYANSLLALIADAVGIPKNRTALKKEFEEFKEEAAEAKLRKDLTEAIQMDQIIALLSRADATSSFKEKEVKYHSKRNSLGSQPLEPLQSFYCPITRDVMEDPVETSSGQTFERSAIERWFADGNTTCPLTMTPLNTSFLRPNITLRKSIEEWKERNNIIIISSMKSKLSLDDEVVLRSLAQLQELCEEKFTNRECVVMEDYLPILVGLLGRNNSQIRNHTLCILRLLVEDSDDNREKIAEVDNAIRSIVKSLARRTDERKAAVALLLELSKNNAFCGHIGKMLSLSDADGKRMAIKAIQKLSSFGPNGLQIIRDGAISPLLDLLFQAIPASPNLRDQVAATILNITVSATALQTNEALSILKSDAEISRLFSLVMLTGPTIQHSILGTFYALCQLPSAKDMRTKLRQFSAVQLLISQCEHRDLLVRASAVKLLSCLMEDGDDNVSAESVTQGCLETLLSIIKTSKDEEEVAAALRIISDLPIGYTHVTRWIADVGAITVFVSYIRDAKLMGPFRNKLIENALRVLCRFTMSTNPECQKIAAQSGLIPLLVQLLGSGTPAAKRYAATLLCQFSESSLSLSRLVQRHGGFWCFAPPPEIRCPVHNGVCSVETSYCLLEADAIGPLLSLLGESDSSICDAALSALSTLIEGERLQSGSKVLHESNGIAPIIEALSSRSTELQEKALNVLERIFRLQEYKQIYGASAQMPLVDITQRSNGPVRALAARILAHLDVLHDQSSYF
ncbi:hypothetical protein BHE74_00026021 [Ensete ventricosum]|nr:hypothetical protein GW17_00053377 [Ensete ventricosum]RWW66602.1 hypothetical protein BHE74_00026021 [Ensete ventricosum]RZS19221.1 hypothetical protein BHM03_00051594 [Ensete ventricosum]